MKLFLSDLIGPYYTNLLALEKFGDSLSIVFILLVISIAGRIGLSLAGQTWINTYAHTATVTTLPIITYVITKLISGNIALSLGMVGALSIVRFRNPVKSPFELSVYFTAITLGIAASVSIKWVYFLAGSISLALIILKIIEIFYSFILKKDFFQTSFSEGNSLSNLHISSPNYIPKLLNNSMISSVNKSNNSYDYFLISNDEKKLLKVLEEIKEEYEATDFRLNK